MTFQIDHVVDRLRTTWPNSPTDWETAAAMIVYELSYSAGYDINDMESEHVEAYYEDGRIDILARGALHVLNEPFRIDPEVFSAMSESLPAFLASKQSDYGPRNILKFGEAGLEVRLWDKIARLSNLRKSGARPQNESIKDTLIDIVGYTVIAIMLRLDWFELPVQEKW